MKLTRSDHPQSTTRTAARVEFPSSQQVSRDRWMISVLLPLVLLCCAPTASKEDWVLMRKEMIKEIEISAVQSGIALDGKVLDAMNRVARHEFVPESARTFAYQNRPLPIGLDQTISQPFIVALMTDLIKPSPDARILELGTGSGYQAAVLAELVAEVFTIEIVQPLGLAAANRLKNLGYDNVQVRIGNGIFGWQEHAPYDGIIVTAAGIETPPALIKQLKTGGRLVIPLGEQYEVQRLMVMTKQPDGTLKEHYILPVRFVPITGSSSDDTD